MKTYHSLGSVSVLLGISYNAALRAQEAGTLRVAATYDTSTKRGRPLFTDADVAAYRDRLVTRLLTYPQDRKRGRRVRKLRAVRL